MIITLVPKIKGAILDLDGVLWRGNQPLGNLPGVFKRFSELEIKVVLASNNATQNVQQVLEKVEKFGVALNPEQVVNSALTMAYFLKKKHPQGGPVYVVGESGLVKSLEDYGFYQAEQDVLGVVAGLDRHVTYEKLRKATLLIRAGAPFYGTNPDPTYPSPEGLVPGAGTILAAIQAASDVAPIIVGKPYPAMFELALERLGTQKSETIMVGDRLDTDILGGQQAGCRTGMVLSGVSTLEELESWNPKPDLVAADLTAMLG